MKGFTKYKFKYPNEKFNEKEIDDIKTVHDYAKALNKQERKNFIKQFDEIAIERIMNEIFDFYNFLAKAIKHNAEPIELYNAIPTNKTISKDMARKALITLLDGYGVDTAYFGTEIKESEEILITFIEQQ